MIVERDPAGEIRRPALATNPRWQAAERDARAAADVLGDVTNRREQAERDLREQTSRAATAYDRMTRNALLRQLDVAVAAEAVAMAELDAAEAVLSAIEVGLVGPGAPHPNHPTGETDD